MPPLGYALLGLIHQQPASGYALRKVFAETAMGSYSSSPGAIYPALQRLEEQRLVSSKVDRSRSLRPKKIYQSTAQGTKLLRGWLQRPITSEDVKRRLDELLLRFAFYPMLESTLATRSFLESFRRQVEDYVTNLENQLKAFPPEAPIHSRLALEGGIEQYRTWARWARNALSQFEEDAS